MRTHKDLVLRHRDEGEMVALDAETLNGTIQELMIGNEAGMAIAFAAREQIFDVRALPGNLTEDEQTALGDLLEETGLFTRVSEFRPPGPAGNCGLVSSLPVKIDAGRTL